MENSIIPATKELERIYMTINKLSYDEKLDKNIRIVIQTKGRMKKCIGFHSPKRWLDEKTNEYISEITICAEDLIKHDVFEVMLHEIVHSFNFSRGISDCCTNQYHNHYFKDIAEKHGLKVERDKQYGFCYTSLNEEGENLKNAITPNYELFKTFRLKGNVQETYLKKFVCECGMIIRVARINTFSATCNNCHSEFKQED
jgi:hypothetical protein